MIDARHVLRGLTHARTIPPRRPAICPLRELHPAKSEVDGHGGAAQRRREIRRILGTVIKDGAETSVRPNSYVLWWDRLGNSSPREGVQPRDEPGKKKGIRVSPRESVALTAREGIDFTRKTVQEHFPECDLHAFMSPTTDLGGRASLRPRLPRPDPVKPSRRNRPPPASPSRSALPTLHRKAAKLLDLAADLPRRHAPRVHTLEVLACQPTQTTLVPRRPTSYGNVGVYDLR